MAPVNSLLGNQGQKLGCVEGLSFAHDGMGWALLGVCCVPASWGSPDTEQHLGVPLLGVRKNGPGVLRAGGSGTWGVYLEGRSRKEA